MQSNTILFLNENPLPDTFTQGTVSGKELRLRSALKEIDHVLVLAFKGPFVHHPTNSKITPLESKIRIIHLPSFPYYLRTLPLFIFGLYYSRKYRPLILEAESPIISGLAAACIKSVINIPILIEVRASYSKLLHYRLRFIPLKIKRSLLTWIKNFVFTQADLIIANSRYYAHQLKKQGFQALVINPGLQPPPPSPKTTKSNPPLTIGYLGRLVPEKGVNLFIQSLTLLPSTCLQQIKVEIAGIGPSLNSLKQLVHHFHLGKTVMFLGMVESYSVLKRWDILVNPNLVNHPLEMVNAEAAAMGIPVVCFGNDQIPETVIHYQTGIKVKSPTAKSLSNAICQLIDNPGLRHRLGKQAQTFAVRQYDFHLQKTKLGSAYLSLNLLT